MTDLIAGFPPRDSVRHFPGTAFFQTLTFLVRHFQSCKFSAPLRGDGNLYRSNQPLSDKNRLQTLDALISCVLTPPGGFVITRASSLVRWLVGNLVCLLSKSTNPIFAKFDSDERSSTK